MAYQLQVRMKGDLGERLLLLRERTGLQRRGRLTDDWDEEFGRRELRPSEAGLVTLSLWRYADDDWVMSLTYRRDPLPSEEAEELKRTILNAAAEAGMTITAVVPRTLSDE
ncbi:hypothetical protein ABZ752_32865 [Streptomyces roseifaciens]